ncbi:Vegetative incompatibility protein HET-E-1 [Ceratobasidium sp. AG-Ba]|nr:Vegetative incompatibility protein HET-E-1 [Ceratobasidium sp. AG-Ba]
MSINQETTSKRKRVKRFIRGLFSDNHPDQGAPTSSQPGTPPLIPAQDGTTVEHANAPTTRALALSSAPTPANRSITPSPAGPRATRPGGISQSGVTAPTGEVTSYRGWTGLRLLAGVLSKTPGAFGPLKSAADVLVAFIGTFEAVAEKRTEFQELRERLDDLFNDLKDYIDTPASHPITTSIKNLQEGIEKETTIIKQMQDRGGITPYLNAERDMDQILGCYKRIEGLFQRLALNANIKAWKTIEELVAETYLDKLPKSLAAYYNSTESDKLNRGKCTQNTRVDVLQELRNWASGASTEKIYWLNGMAGTGKTTIAYSLCQYLQGEKALAASFFCSRQLPECRDVNRIIPTIAYQLSRVSTPFFHVICPMLRNDPEVYNKPILDQFEQLIVEPVNRVKSALPSNLVIVIDALDECEANTGIAKILNALLAYAPDLPVRFFVSSRPEASIMDRMRKKQAEGVNTEMRLHELDRKVVETDIRTYLKESLKPLPNLSNADLEKLVERSGVLFIYASTAVRYIADDDFSRGPTRLEEVLRVSDDSRSEKTVEIDVLYANILASAFKSQKSERDRDEMTSIIRTVICAQEPLSIDTMAGLLQLDINRCVVPALRPLFSILQVSDTGVITTLHESFRDFLLDASRSDRFFCDPEEQHARLSDICFSRISVATPFNICGLESSYKLDKDVPGLDERVKELVSGALYYSCRYWVPHVILASKSKRLANRLYEFLSKRLMLWMEILNLKNAFDEGRDIMHEANEQLQELPFIGSEAKTLLQDGLKFMNAYTSTPVLLSTPHLYISALLFWPQKSPLRAHYKIEGSRVIGKASTAIKMRRVTPLVTIRLNTGCKCLGHSPDGKNVVIGLGNRAEIRNVSTGRQIGQPLQGHTQWVTSVGYSPDGAYIVSGSYDKTVRIWSARTGEQVGQPLHGHTQWVTSVGYSPDGAYIVSGSSDNTVRVWSARTGEQVRQPLHGHTSSVTSVGYSPDGAYIVSGSYDKTVRIWSARTGEQVGQPLHGHTDSVTSVGYSPDGAYIVSGSLDDTVRIWSVRTGEQVRQPLHGHTSLVTSVGYSPDGAYIVSGSYDKTVRIWSARTGEQVRQPLHGHTREVTSVGYSPDGAYIVSGSRDKTVRIWSARTGEQVRQPLHGHTSSVTSVGYSPDGAYIVSGSLDNTVRIWSARTGEQVGQPLHGHTDSVTSVGYSPDGAYIVSGSDDKTVRIWSARTGEQVGQPLHGHTSLVTSVGYSADGAYIVSGSWDKTVRIWSARAGQQVTSSLVRHTDFVTSVAYSPRESLVTFGTNEHTVPVWNLQLCHEEGQSTRPTSHIPAAVLSQAIEHIVLPRNQPFSHICSSACDRRGFHRSWTIDEHGWVILEDGELLVWIPPDLIPTVLHPRGSAIASSRYGVLHLDIHPQAIGNTWSEYLNPSSSCH